MDIWLATWNCENQAPPNAQLQNFIAHDYNQLAANNGVIPDIVVIALQEAKPDAAHQFVAERVAAAAPFAGVFNHVASHFVKGMTKGTINYIHIGLLVRANQAHLVARHMTGHFKSGLEGKGGAFITITYNNQEFCFIGAHLNSKDPIKRNAEIEGVLGAVARKYSPNAQTTTQVNQVLNSIFHAVFFMGDLNYRLAAGQVVVQGAQVNLAQGSTVGNVVNYIASPTGRVGLHRLDTLTGSPLVVTYGFTFPLMDHLLPTYKRDYKTAAANNSCAQLAASLNNNAPGQNQLTVPQTALAAGCYFRGYQQTDVAPFSTKRNAFDLGWLDRIGYKAAPGVVQNPIIKSYDNIVLSDHTPVLLRVTV